MELNISDEMIEKMVREQVKARVNQYIAERTKANPYWISDLYRSCAAYEVSKIVDNKFVEESCKGLCKDHIAEKVIERFANRISSCFDYYDY